MCTAVATGQCYSCSCSNLTQMVQLQFLTRDWQSVKWVKKLIPTSVCAQMVSAPSAARGKVGESSRAGVTDSALEQQLAALKDLWSGSAVNVYRTWWWSACLRLCGLWCATPLFCMLCLPVNLNTDITLAAELPFSVVFKGIKLNDRLSLSASLFLKFFLFFSENLSLFICSGVPVDTEVKVLSAEDPELSDVPSFKAGVGQSTALHAWPAARNSAFRVSAFLVHLFNICFLQMSQNIKWYMWSVVNHIFIYKLISFVYHEMGFVQIECHGTSADFWSEGLRSTFRGPGHFVWRGSTVALPWLWLT